MLYWLYMHGHSGNIFLITIISHNMGPVKHYSSALIFGNAIFSTETKVRDTYQKSHLKIAHNISNHCWDPYMLIYKIETHCVKW